MNKFLWSFCLVLFLEVASAQDVVWKDQVDRMKSYLDESVDPCKDFYSFACGKWSKVHHHIQHGDVLGLVSTEINKQIRDLLQDENENSDTSVGKAKIFYNSCVKTTNYSIAQFLQNLKILEMFNFNATEVFDEWWIPVAELHLYGVSVLLEASVLPYWDNSSENVIYIDKAPFSSLQRDHYLNESFKQFLDVYRSSVADLFILLGHSEDEGNLIAGQIVDFEKDLAGAMSKSSDEETEEYVLGYLAQYIPAINWIKYLSIILERDVDLYETVNVVNARYFATLADIVSKVDKIILKNYFVFKILTSLDDFQKFDEEECANLLRSKLGNSLSYAYVKKYYNKTDTVTVFEIVSHLKESFTKVIDSSNWLDDQAKNAAKFKLNSTLSSISLEGDKNLNQIDEYYKDLELVPDNFHLNYWEVSRYQVRKEHGKLKIINERWNHDKGQAVANAYYLKTQNLVVIPAGILQSPIYKRQFPKAYNYGVLGTIIGHEISHGFDFNGKDYDADGNINNWWDDKTTEAYHERMNCMIQQYNNYSSKGLENVISGLNTISENIADNCGLKLAYEAFKGLDDSENAAYTLGMTNRQLFFLSFAQFFCSEIEHNNLLVTKLFSEHSIDKFRVVGTLSNMEEFSKEFKCPPGSQMNPVQKCRIW